MTSVFIGGSRNISRLNPAIRERLNNIIQKNFTVFIGDANGADKAVQKYLAEKGYRNVIVFCMEGVSRNNLGQWDTRSVPANSRRKDFRYYVRKDVEMAKEASYGFMLWDGRSKGTLNNVLNLLRSGKTVLVYFSPEKKFCTLCRACELRQLLEKCDRDVLEKLRKQVPVSASFVSGQADLELT